MNDIQLAAYSTLNKAKILLLRLENKDICNESVPPYYSSIGCHIRHILDFYKCIFDGFDIGKVDLTNRDRNMTVEQDCICALDYLDDILKRIKLFQNNAQEIISVEDDLGQGKIKIQYTAGALLAQANSHTIHHYAIISYILDQLGICMEDENFGYNPTSPKKVNSTS